MQVDASTLQRVPLDHVHRSLGARMVAFAGYEMPVNYPKGILQEHAHTRSHAGLFDVSHMGCIFIEGDSAAIHLERLLPSDLQEMTLGQVKYSFLMNLNGGIEDDLLVSRLAQGFLLVVNASRKQHDLSYLQSHLPSEVKITPRFDKAMLALQGPKASHVMEQLCPATKTLKFMNIMETSLLGYPVFISRTGYTGEDGFEVICSAEAALPIFQHLLQHPEVEPIGLGARDSLRLEAGLCLYGHELNETISPIEAGLSWAIGKRRRVEGQFLGAERILKELQTPPLRCRIGLTPNCKSIPREGCLIYIPEGQQIGQVTSGSQSPSLGFPIAMGFIERQYIGAPIQVSIRGQLYPAHQSRLPFIRPNYCRD
ncbi:glycine cleavage system aminomethyltransferase GcvT [Candidatus Odyssella thessalonicensis]|uniref:glycine cleavage system aminomethyltransferase GcvT n=1 Tax=Candidatus Odyssella thessalonicensis TaxID=84647 RepID=UPI000225ABB3|nr:glycine cleavage system aminomethyltransferase GcvT [Candidatus Odyssella thessalonicensis]